MSLISVERPIRVQSGVVWALLRDFPNIAAFNPNLERSTHIGDTPLEGLGAERQCDLKDGRNWIRERVVDWHPGVGYTVEIYAGTMPIRDIRTSLRVMPDGAGSRATMHISYTPKFGPLGRLLDILLLRRKMTSLMRIVLEGLEAKASLNGAAASHA